ncbi:DUF6802 family protein [Gordonia sp. CPCC 205515]|uniref:DUF6802 family protein n=1 Tax=Gordonia sp. CPCC 205515 TaxID=3140791 RepID=UPI003AF3A4E7
MSFLGGEPSDGHFGDGPFEGGHGISAETHPVAHITDEATSTSPVDHLWMHSDGRVWDLGPADVDTDSDGIPDSLTRSGPDGLAVYTDTDHDGQVDKITEVDGHGGFTSRTLDPASGVWQATDSGRLG